MPGFMPGIHVFVSCEFVDGRDEPGHDVKIKTCRDGRTARRFVKRKQGTSLTLTGADGSLLNALAREKTARSGGVSD
jgi:hypothetical protein